MRAGPGGESKERELSWLGMSIWSTSRRTGYRVLFSGLPEGAGRGPTYLRQTDGSPAVRLGDGGAQALSPDGKWALALQVTGRSSSLLPTGAGEAKTWPVPGGADLGRGNWFSRQPAWSSSLPRGEASPPGPTRRTSTGGEPRAVGPRRGVGGARVVFPDGAGSRWRTSRRDRVLLPVDGGEPRPCPGIERGDRADSVGRRRTLDLHQAGQEPGHRGLSAGTREWPANALVGAGPS